MGYILLYGCGGRGALRRKGRGEAGSLAEGTIIAMDLDGFEEIVAERGWSRYRPNPATGLLTRLVEDLVRRWQGVVVYGLDEERGTEEAVIEIPLVEPEELREDLERIRREVNRLGVGITIVAVRGEVLGRPGSRREAYTATPARRYAARLLRRAKRSGGNRVVIG